jgi:hypothetical protein
MSHRSRRLPRRVAFVTALFAAVPAAAAITGICPDGSIFVVQSADAIPCARARRVDPSDMPPIQPKLLPRPYGWERFNRRADPNNPYNLVGDANAQGGAPPPPDPGYAPPPDPGFAPPQVSGPSPPPGPRATAPGVAPAGPPQVAAYAPSSRRGPDLALTPDEVADLDEIVALLQSIAPATLARYADDGQRRAVLQLAHSPGFEHRLHGALSREGVGPRGPVLLFRAEARAEEAVHGNLTFVQGHVAFHPDPEDPDQFGVIDGALGPLAAGDRVLGYAVLPEHLDPAQPLDIYWDDRRITATLR